MLIIGLDPGLSGAVGVLDGAGGFRAAWDLPIIRDARTAWVDGGELLRALLRVIDGEDARFYVERVHSMPKQGVASSFAFGVSFGSLLGTLRCLFHPIELVPPSQWKRDLGLLKAGKIGSLDKARLLFPTADLSKAKHDGRAEALLLAHWALTCANGSLAKRD